METLLITRELEGSVAVVTFNRPAVHNAMNTRMGEELISALRELSFADDLRALVLTGAGNRAFCTGGDLKERLEMTDDDWQRQHRIFEEAFRAVREFPSPTIAAVEGYVVGGGCEMALSCDFIISSEAAVYQMPEAKRGILPGGGGTQLLPRMIGRNRAKLLLFTARRFSAQDAERWGLAVGLAPAGQARQHALEVAAEIAVNAPIAVRQMKKAVDLGSDVELHTGLALTLEAYNVLVPTEDRREGVRAFNEKRPPRWRNR